MTETYLREIRPRRMSELDRLALEVHERNHHPHMEGEPCWGPTLADQDEAKRILRERASSS